MPSELVSTFSSSLFVFDGTLQYTALIHMPEHDLMQHWVRLCVKQHSEINLYCT